LPVSLIYHHSYENEGDGEENGNLMIIGLMKNTP